jgi:hypothetical protein
MKILGTIFITLIIGLIIGAQWYRLNIFPFPQLQEWKAATRAEVQLPNLEQSIKLVTTIYSNKTPVFLDRLYYDSIGDNRLEGLYLLQIPRHYSDIVRIKSSKDLVIYRAISDNNNNRHYKNWESSEIPINIQGVQTTQTKIIKKMFPANNIIELDSGGPFSSDPIFIKLKDYVAPTLKFMVLENIRPISSSI